MISTEPKISFETIAILLGLEPKKLSYVIYKIPDDKKYNIFDIPKKTGGKRTISKPVPKLLNIQRKFKDYLMNYYRSKACSHGFEKNKDIKSNAIQHLKSKILLNLDIHDFFGSINFGRVYGLFLNEPFNFDKQAAAAFSKLVTFQNKLPQGAPTSPILANMIARRMDSALTKLASINRCTYTRYVDDITFSTTRYKFEKEIVEQGNIDDVVLGSELVSMITRNGFIINQNKTRQLNQSVRKEVTGITINQFPNVRRKYINSVFGMIFSWKKHGYDNALDIYKENYLKLKPSESVNKDIYRSVIIGKISFVAHIRGWDDVVVHKLCRKYCECDKNPPDRIKVIGDIFMKYNVFIGHASEQKDTVAIPLNEALTKIGIKSFIDKVEIKWGDSLTRIINKALADSDYFLAIISMDSITKSWPDTEMNSAIARQIDGKQKVLPLFIGSTDEIEKCKSHYSLLADRYYKIWQNNPDQIAKEIQELLNP